MLVPWCSSIILKLVILLVLRLIRHYLQFPTTRSNPDIYSPGTDPTSYKPKERAGLIKTFVKKLKDVLLRRVRRDNKWMMNGACARVTVLVLTLSLPAYASQVTRGGSTEKTELQKLFVKYGDRRGVLSFQAFKPTINSLGIKTTHDEAEQVFQHFAEEKYGGIRSHEFIDDVLSDVRYVTISCVMSRSPPKLQFHLIVWELMFVGWHGSFCSHWSKMPTTLQLGPAADSEQSIDSYRSDLYKFTSRPIRRPVNNVVEKFKQSLKYVCDQKILKSGDLMYWVLLRAFSLW